MEVQSPEPQVEQSHEDAQSIRIRLTPADVDLNDTVPLADVFPCR